MTYMRRMLTVKTMIDNKDSEICLLLSISFTSWHVQSAENGNFEDADRGSDFATSSFGDADGQWDLRHSIPGEPEIDYPIYSVAPKTSFSCDNRHEGYYADVETRCQVFRICTNTDLSGEGFAFLCPNGTLFSQRDFVCDWYRNVDCTESENFYFKNEGIGTPDDKDELMKAVKEMVEFPMKTITKTIQKTPKGSAPSVKPTKSSINQHHDVHDNRNQGASGKDKNRVTNSNKDFTINVENESNEEIQVKSSKKQQHHNQNQHHRNNGHHGNGGRNNQNGRQNNSESRNKLKGSSSNSGRDRIETDESDKFIPPRVYVNSLGELSTDPGVNFDPRTSYVIEPDQSSRRGKVRNRDQKKSLDDVLGDSASGKNHVEVERREKLKQGLPGTDSKRVRVSGKIKASISGGVDDNGDNHSAVASKTKLSFAERINAGLNGFENSDSLELSANGNTSNIPEFVRNFIDKKTNRKQNESKKQQPEDDHDKFLNLADNVNGGFLSNDHSGSTHTHIHKEYHLDKTVSYHGDNSNSNNNNNNNNNQRKQNRGPKVFNGEDNLSEPIHESHKSSQVVVTPRPPKESSISSSINNIAPKSGAATTNTHTIATNLNVGQAFQGTKSTDSSTKKPVVDEYRSGRQFQFFGSGFTKPGQTPVTLAPFNGNGDKDSKYLPPAHVQPFISQFNSNSNNKVEEVRSRVSIKGPGVVPLHGSTQQNEAQQFSSSRQPKHQNIPNRQVVKGPGRVSLAASLPVQNLIVSEEKNDQVTNDISKTQSISQNESLVPRKPSPYYLPPARFSSRVQQPASNVPDLFLMVGDINAAEETKSSNEDVTVKRRAEALLVQGVQQAFFENEYNGNAIDDSNQPNKAPVLDPLVIHVDEEERKDSDVTNIEKLLVGNIRNFLRTGIENEIKSSERFENTTIDTFDAEQQNNDQSTVGIFPSETTISPITNLITEQTTVSNDFNLSSDSTTESDTFNTTDIVPVLSTTNPDFETTTTALITTEGPTQISLSNRTTTASKLKGISLRRLTVKPINYSKKPYSLRQYPKTSTTAKPNKLTNNIKRRPLNRLALKDLANSETTPASIDSTASGNNETDTDDLQAIANSYRAYRPTTTLSRLRIQNETATKYTRNNRYRSSNLLRNRNAVTTTTSAPANVTTTIGTITTTTVSSVNSSNSTFSSISSNSNNNLSITNLIPFDILSKAIHGNTESTNLQNFKNRFHNLQEQEQSRFNINDTLRGLQKTYQTQSHLSPKALYTQIPGTNIKISKSNEEASFSFDPNTGLRPQPVSASHQTGYVPLEQYITQTLSKTLSSPEFIGNGQLSRQTTINPLQQITIHPTISTQSQNNHNIFSFTSSPILPTFRPSIQGSQIRQQQQQSQLNLNNRGLFTSPSSSSSSKLAGFINNIQQHEQQQQQQQQQQQNQQHFVHQYHNIPPTNPTTSSFSFNQFGSLPPQPILLSSSPQPKTQQIYEPFVQGNGYSQYPLAIFNEIPIAQRRLDLSDDDGKTGKSLYSGVSSYHVPLGSIGRLSGDIAATKRLRRNAQLIS
ncbi:uncharacterized protein DDB_G0283357-like [Condylostylus longicornis]|uniref:uncharacterized protein DDB_G0283357-like n=1 Tax=Condylostylus longicornis TaxID=2530218 RepID=UPI00244E1134|nr:uncharacterized protein DDB_G0283357-like [Condylostylus longicornis]